MTRTRKILAGMLAMVMLLSMICVSTALASEKITLEFYAWLDEEGIFTTMKEAYIAENPNIDINMHFTPSDDYATKLLTALSGGSAIDCFAVASPPSLAEYQAKEQVLAIDDIIAETGTDTSGCSATFEALKIDGKAYALPYKTSSWVIFYNKDLFDAAGVAYPTGDWTWEEYFELAGKLTSGEGADKIYGSLNFQPTSLWWRLPANSKGANNPMDPAMLEDWLQAAEYALSLSKAGYQPDYADRADEAGKDYTGAFLQGKYAMFYNGDWEIEMLNTAVKEGNEINYDIAPLPHWADSPAQTSGAPGLLMVAKNSQYQKEAFDFIRFVTGAEGAKILVANDYLPSWQSEDVIKAYTEEITVPEHISFILSQTINSQVPCDPLYNAAANIVKEEVSLYLLEEQDMDTTRANIVARLESELS